MHLLSRCTIFGVPATRYRSLVVFGEIVHAEDTKRRGTGVSLERVVAYGFFLLKRTR